MTYLHFHLVFLLPPILVLALLTWRDLARGERLSGSLGGSSRLAWQALAAHLVVAFIYTTPWDNYLVASGVWGYGEERVLATVGFVPVEEYAFFLLQPILTGLFLFFLARRWAPEPGRAGAGGRGLGALVFLLVSAAGVLALGVKSGRYFGLIAVWACPLLALQWAFGGDLLVERGRLLLVGLGVPTLYLWLADRVAIERGIWWISPEQTSGVSVAGLPIEEALFFLVTNLLVGFGLTLVLHPRAMPRAAALAGSVRAWWRAALALWALSMIPVPLVPERFAEIVHVSTTLLALGVLGYALGRYGARAWLLFAAATSFGWAVEWLGSRSGFPFGAYAYSESYPSLAGVPLIVPLGWWAFALVALAVAPSRYKLFWAPLALVAWDLGLDPLMVQQGFWTWQPPGFYYGVPLSNFLGWYGAGLLLSVLLTRLEPRLLAERGLELRLVFVAQAFLMSVGLLVFGMPLAALLTFVAMGGLAAATWLGGTRALRWQRQ